MPSSSTTIISKSTIYPHQSSPLKTLKLSVSDLPMLSCHYIQKGILLPPPPFSFSDLLLSLKRSLSLTLSLFPPLSGRLVTDSLGHLHILCNDSGVLFFHATAKHLPTTAASALSNSFKEFFPFNNTISFSGHHLPLLAVQVTELADAVFIGITVNHAVADGTSFWHFFNTFAAISRGAKVSKLPDFTRDNTVFDSPAVLKLPAGGPKVTFDDEQPLRERIFHFSREAILKLKLRANNNDNNITFVTNGFPDSAGFVKKQTNGTVITEEISSFQSLSAQLWRSVTRARNLDPRKTSTFRMAVNCRHRLRPRMESFYFGNAIQSIPTVALVGEILSRDLQWIADLLHRNVVAHDDATVRRGVEDWEKSPRLFPLGNFDGASMTMGSSPRFPMYDNDFGWGKPLAIRSGKANKFDGKISAFPGREGNGSVDLEVVLAPETMVGLENDMEFMQYVTTNV